MENCRITAVSVTCRNGESLFFLETNRITAVFMLRMQNTVIFMSWMHEVTAVFTWWMHTVTGLFMSRRHVELVVCLCHGKN